MMPPDMLAINTSLAKDLDLYGDGMSVCEDPVSKVFKNLKPQKWLIFTTSPKVLLRESRAALVQTTEELVGTVKVKDSRGFMVDCEVEDGFVKDLPHLWRRIQLTREAGGSLLQLLVDGREFLEKGVHHHSISSAISIISMNNIISVILIRDIFCCFSFLYFSS